MIWYDLSCSTRTTQEPSSFSPSSIFACLPMTCSVSAMSPVSTLQFREVGSYAREVLDQKPLPKFLIFLRRAWKHMERSESVRQFENVEKVRCQKHCKTSSSAWPLQRLGCQTCRPGIFPRSSECIGSLLRLLQFVDSIDNIDSNHWIDMQSLAIMLRSIRVYQSTTFPASPPQMFVRFAHVYYPFCGSWHPKLHPAASDMKALQLRGS